MIRKLLTLGAVGVALFLAACVPALAQSVGVAPDLFSIVAGGGTSAVTLFAVAHFVAVIVCSVTATPNPDTTWGRVYAFVELLAMVTRSTKDTGVPLADKLNLVADMIPDADKAVATDTAKAIPADATTKAVSGAAAVVLAFVIALGALVAACTPTQIQDAATKVATVDASLMSTVQAGCAEFAPIAAPLANAPDPKLASIVATGAGMCDLASGKVVASGVPNIDPTTAAWLGLMTGVLKAAVTVPAAPAPAAPVAVAPVTAAPVAATQVAAPAHP